jgi:hypothetical protein
MADLHDFPVVKKRYSITLKLNSSFFALLGGDSAKLVTDADKVKFVI